MESISNTATPVTPENKNVPSTRESSHNLLKSVPSTVSSENSGRNDIIEVESLLAVLNINNPDQAYSSSTFWINESTNNQFVKHFSSSDEAFEILLQKQLEPVVIPYFRTLQKEIRPKHRKSSVQWILDLCNENKCTHDVFPTAVAYMDRYLSIKELPLIHIDLLAVTCLLIAMKIRGVQRRIVPLESFSNILSEQGFTKKDLADFELKVLKALEWKLSTVLSLDFVEMLIIRLPITLPYQLVSERVRKMLAVTPVEKKFSRYLPSTLAAAGIYVTLHELKREYGPVGNIESILKVLISLVNVPGTLLEYCSEKLVDLMKTVNIAGFLI